MRIKKILSHRHNILHIFVGTELDRCPGFNLGLLGLNLGHRFKVDPTWALPQCISENTKISLNQQPGESKRRRRRNKFLETITKLHELMFLYLWIYIINIFYLNNNNNKNKYKKNIICRTMIFYEDVNLVLLSREVGTDSLTD